MTIENGIIRLIGISFTHSANVWKLRLLNVRKDWLKSGNWRLPLTVKTHNITPEELAQVVEMIRSGNPMPLLGIAEDESVKPAKARKETKKDGSFEPEENEDEKT